MQSLTMLHILGPLALALLQLTEASPLDGGAAGNDNHWLQRKAEFYANTTFELSPGNLRLFGGNFSLIQTGHLPFWFDFELYKTVFNKNYQNPAEELERHHIYIKTCIRALKARTLYRILAGVHDTKITKEADLVSTKGHVINIGARPVSSSFSHSHAYILAHAQLANQKRSVL